VTTQRAKGERFKALHARAGAFVIPNPWDAGSARVLAGLGFEALATTSVGLANSLARIDGEVKRDELMEHCRALCAATDLPVSADMENGFGRDPETVAQTIRLAAGAGLSGGSIEDYSGDRSDPIYDFNLAVERVHAAAEAAHALEVPFILTARAENLLRAKRHLDEAIRRLQAFETAGADVLYAPGLATLDEVRTITREVHKPVNVLAPFLKNVTVTELADAGAKRISVGGALARAAMTALVRAGVEIRDRGTFGWATDLVAPGELARLLGRA
jgi:2-methylisocitrate lyase-like PEP mutase family enzyme